MHGGQALKLALSDGADFMIKRQLAAKSLHKEAARTLLSCFTTPHRDDQAVSAHTVELIDCVQIFFVSYTVLPQEKSKSLLSATKLSTSSLDVKSFCPFSVFCSAVNL